MIGLQSSQHSRISSLVFNQVLLPVWTDALGVLIYCTDICCYVQKSRLLTKCFRLHYYPLYLILGVCIYSVCDFVYVCVSLFVCLFECACVCMHASVHIFSHTTLNQIILALIFYCNHILQI